MPIRTACYVHTPFCAIKCLYCNFFSDVREPGEDRGWLAALESEIRFHGRRGRYDGRVFDTLFLGGGTPTALEAGELERLFRGLREHLRFDPAAEVTSEANPRA
jgi:oxygen-independent coproporphyrinogen-3 oxidase